jgi:hypothetical protein
MEVTDKLPDINAWDWLVWRNDEAASVVGHQVALSMVVARDRGARACADWCMAELPLLSTGKACAPAG